MNDRTLRHLWWAAAAVGVLLLVGCGPETESPPGAIGTPENPGKRLPVVGYEDSTLPAAVQAFDGDGALTVVTMGSSSCPNIPEVVRVDDSERLVLIRLTSWEANACTADLAARTFELEVGSDLESFRVEVTPD